MDEVLNRIASALERIAESNEKLASWAIGDTKKVFPCIPESTELNSSDNNSREIPFEIIHVSESDFVDKIDSFEETTEDQVKCKTIVTRSSIRHEDYVSMETLRNIYHGVVAPVIRKQAAENNIECFVFKKHDYFLKSDLKKLVKVCKLRKRNNVALIENKAKNS